MVVKMEDLKVGMEIAFSSLDNVDYDGWKVELNTPYLITKAVDWRVEVNLYSEELGNFYVECDELRDVYIFDSNKKEENKELVFTDAKVNMKGVIIDEEGIKGYDSDGKINFHISSSGEPWFKGKEGIKPLSTLEVLDLIARYYDSIPSELIQELSGANLYK